MARYRPNDPRDYLAALDFINNAKEQGFDIELKKFYEKRSHRQNGYLYFCLAYFAHIYGCTELEAKEVFLKRLAAPQIFEVEYEVDGKSVKFYRSTADLDTAEMTSAIRNFTAYAEMNNIYIPMPDDELGRRYCEQQMEKSNGFR